MKFVTPGEAVRCIKSNERVFVHSVAAASRLLVDAMAAVLFAAAPLAVPALVLVKGRRAGALP